MNVMNAIESWALQHNISPTAIFDLKLRLGMHGNLNPIEGIESEAQVKQQYRFQAAEHGELMWSNNVGAMQDESGRVVRYGLCNDSAKLNKELKSCDLIGIKPVLIQQHHVGQTIGQFKGREMKRSGWQYSDTPHEAAQLRYIHLVNAHGGDAAFATGPDWGK